MRFGELLRIEFMKVKRSKIIPLIFIAPLLVVISGIANLSSYFTPEYTNAWPAMFIQSALVYAYYLLPFSMIVVCVMIAGPGKRKQRYSENACPAGKSVRSVPGEILCAGVLSAHGNGCILGCVRHRWIGCNTDHGNHRNIADSLSAQMVHRVIPDHAAMRGSYVGNYGAD